jgi:hypothetical protein
LNQCEPFSFELKQIVDLEPPYMQAKIEPFVRVKYYSTRDVDNGPFVELGSSHVKKGETSPKWVNEWFTVPIIAASPQILKDGGGVLALEILNNNNGKEHEFMGRVLLHDRDLLALKDGKSHDYRVKTKVAKKVQKEKKSQKKKKPVKAAPEVPAPVPDSNTSGRSGFEDPELDENRFVPKKGYLRITPCRDIKKARSVLNTRTSFHKTQFSKSAVVARFARDEPLKGHYLDARPGAEHHSEEEDAGLSRKELKALEAQCGTFCSDIQKQLEMTVQPSTPDLVVRSTFMQAIHKFHVRASEIGTPQTMQKKFRTHIIAAQNSIARTAKKQLSILDAKQLKTHMISRAKVRAPPRPEICFLLQLISECSLSERN